MHGLYRLAAELLQVQDRYTSVSDDLNTLETKEAAAVGAMALAIATNRQSEAIHRVAEALEAANARPKK